MPHGDFEKMIVEKHAGTRNPNFGPTQFSKVLFGVASVMAKVHSRNVIHRDLKPLNVFLDENWEMKLADFGLSKVVSESTQMTMSIGSPICMAPELWNAISEGEARPYGKPVDVYAFGIMVLQVFGKAVVEGTPVKGTIALMRRISDGKRFVRPNGVPEPLWHLITQCWAQGPESRPEFSRIVEAMLEKPEDYVLPGTDIRQYKEYQARINAEPPALAMPDLPPIFAFSGSIAGALTVSNLAKTDQRYMQELHKSLRRSATAGPEQWKRMHPWNFLNKPGTRA
jgi:serine/threonine protein kinase